jgi:hypothetical protein
MSPATAERYTQAYDQFLTLSIDSKSQASLDVWLYGAHSAPGAKRSRPRGKGNLSPHIGLPTACTLRHGDAERAAPSVGDQGPPSYLNETFSLVR